MTLLILDENWLLLMVRATAGKVLLAQHRHSHHRHEPDEKEFVGNKWAYSKSYHDEQLRLLEVFHLHARRRVQLL